MPIYLFKTTDGVRLIKADMPSQARAFVWNKFCSDEHKATADDLAAIVLAATDGKLIIEDAQAPVLVPGGT